MANGLEVVEVSPVSRLMAQALDHAGRAGRRVVDVGSGIGGSIRAVQERNPHLHVLGVDLSLQRSGLATRYGVPVVVGDAVALPLARQSVDVVVTRHVLEHIEDHVGAAAEMTRVLRPGGYLYLDAPLRLPGAWYPYKNAAGTRVLDPTHVREYRSIDELASVVRSGGGLRLVDYEVQRISYALAELVARARRRVVPGPSAPAIDARGGRRVALPRYRNLSCLFGPK